jgi:hypothetical protein
MVRNYLDLRDHPPSRDAGGPRPHRALGYDRPMADTYDAPRIEARAPLEGALMPPLTSAVDLSAAFRPV